MTDLVPVGRVGRPHGLDGAFVVEGGSEDESRYAVGAVLHVGEAPATVVLSRRVGGGRRAIKLDRPVERGQELAIPRGALPPPGEDEYYAFQLVGLAVEEEGGRRLGTVRDVLPGAANDNLELDDGTLVPMIEDAIADIDLAHGRVLLNPGFIE
ncbi:MAG: ribosome maturation factor RimM [Gaiellaceae bacterium]